MGILFYAEKPDEFDNPRGRLEGAAVHAFDTMTKARMHLLILFSGAMSEKEILVDGIGLRDCHQYLGTSPRPKGSQGICTRVARADAFRGKDEPVPRVARSHVSIACLQPQP